MSNPIHRHAHRTGMAILLCATALPLTLCTVPAQGQAGGAIKLTLDPKAAREAGLGYYPVRVPLTTTKPAGITKEPAYRAAPKYATIRVGNGPNATYNIAVDEPATGDYKIYLDKNRNGDLTDDGDGTWSGKKEGNGRTMYGLNEYILRASWGTPTKETASGDYGVAFYRFTNNDYLSMFREAARVGTITVDGKPHKVL